MTSRCGWRRCADRCGGDGSSFLAFGMAPFWLMMTGFLGLACMVVGRRASTSKPAETEWI
jgi:hypothetical protein